MTGESDAECDTVYVGIGVTIEDMVLDGCLEVYPNPFTESTRVIYRVDNGGFTDLSVYDMMGRKVRSLVRGSMDPGTYDVILEHEGMESGVYYVILTSGEVRTIRKIVKQ